MTEKELRDWEERIRENISEGMDALQAPRSLPPENETREQKLARIDRAVWGLVYPVKEQDTLRDLRLAGGSVEATLDVADCVRELRLRRLLVELETDREPNPGRISRIK